MKKFFIYTFLYAFGIFLSSVFYSTEYGNAFFLVLTAMGLLYNIAIIFDTNVLARKWKFLSAGFVGVFTCFMIFNGGIIPLLYVKELNFLKANAFQSYLEYGYLFKYTVVTAIANIAFWIGYAVKLGDYLFAFYYEGLGYKKLLQGRIGILFPKVLIVLGIGLNLVLFYNGAYGRSIVEPLEVSGFVRYLVNFSTYIEKIALIGYFILALHYFRSGKHTIWFYTTLIIQILFALLSGSRGGIIFLFIVTALPYYYVNRKFTKKLYLLGALTVFVAFTIASEIKVFTQNLNRNVSVSEYVDSYMEFRESSNEELNQRIYSEIYYRFMRRLNTVAQGSIAVEYKDEHGVDSDDPDFFSDLVFSPVFAVIPRSMVLPPFPSWGEWFRLKILKQSDSYSSSTTFGMIAYFYLTANWPFVLIGLFFYGVVLRFCNNLLLLGTDSSFLIYLAVLSAVGYISANVPTSYVSFFRFAIFLPVFFFIITNLFNRIRL
ncbi:hypothetical protein MG296_13725 [Flavobacteriaceae bacterium TK19130]|nr:hypothetical protein [Thermobacterium salinum]